MLTAQAEELLGRLKLGSFDPADADALERMSAQEFVADLAERYSIRFQDRQIRDKWEVGAASSLRFELANLSSRSACFPVLTVMPVFRNCVFLSCERDVITGISVARRVAVRPIRLPSPGLALTTGRGFKLDRMPDGWEIKPMLRRTVKLTDEFLKSRGWRFDSLQQFAPRP